jgi:hypothetical protein
MFGTANRGSEELRMSSRVAMSSWICVLWLACAVMMAAPGRTLAKETLTVAGARIEVDMDSGLEGSRRDILQWVSNAADTVQKFYGRFPASDLALRLVARPGGGIQGGHTTNESGARIDVRVGTSVTAKQLAEDWVLVHEMIHLALPEVGGRHSWLSEGLATYVEGIARAQAGRRAIPDVWAEYTRSMPVGLPRGGEGGLDQTRTWARTYWGGALFCMLADIGIRRRSNNEHGLRDALVAILRETGGYTSAAGARGIPIDEVFRIGDEATRSTVLTDLYSQMKQTPVSPDLEKLWAQLGIRGSGAEVEFDDRAPLAALRISMTQRRSDVSGSP